MMITKEKLDFAAKQVVDVCLKAKKGDETFVITDKETKHIADAVINRLKQVTGMDVKAFVMEDFGDRPEDGSNPLKLPDVIAAAIKVSDTGAYIAQGKKNELATFRRPLLDLVNSNKRLKYAHMINISDVIMEIGMATDYSLVQKITRKVYDIVVNAEKIRVTTKLGTNFVAEFDPVLRWNLFDGNIQPGTWMNLPEGEVFTTPKTANGKVIVDGVVGDYMIEYGILDKNPIFLDIKDGKVMSLKCENKKLEEEVSKYIKQDENADRIGEFAIGTNIGLDYLIGNLLQDEKYPGVHIAVGDSLGDHTGAKWKSKGHLDMVIQKTTIEVDGKVIMKDGKFQL